MLDKETQQKIASCKALRGKTVLDLISMPKFVENLAAYWKAQKEDRDTVRKSYQAMRKMGGAKGYKLPAHPMDGLESLTAEELAAEFSTLLAGVCNRSAQQRRYIRQICQQAYNLTIAQIVVEEFPELESVLIPKAKAN